MSESDFPPDSTDLAGEKIVIRKEDLADPASCLVLPAGNSQPVPRRTGWLVFMLVVFVVLLVGALVASLAFNWLLLTGPLRRENWKEDLIVAAYHSVVLLASEDGVGTGFVIASHDQEHLLLTNRHVVESASEIQVLLHGGGAYSAAVVGYPSDPDVDLALLRVRCSELRPLGRIARFPAIRPGMEVVAIGHPMGLDYTLTSGIVSAKRDGLLVQTTAAISEGNSGGPLLGESGEVLGVNTMLLIPEEGNSLAFAVKADYVLQADRWEFTENVSPLLNRIQK